MGEMVNDLVFGPVQARNFHVGFLELGCKSGIFNGQRHRAGQLRLVGDGSKLIDSVYVDNAALAHVLAVDRLAPRGFQPRSPERVVDELDAAQKASGKKKVTKKAAAKKRAAVKKRPAKKKRIS